MTLEQKQRVKKVAMEKARAFIDDALDLVMEGFDWNPAEGDDDQGERLVSALVDNLA